jgi:hypothetical protein
MAEKSRLDAVKWRGAKRRLHQPIDIGIRVDDMTETKKIRRLQEVAYLRPRHRKVMTADAEKRRFGFANSPRRSLRIVWILKS